MFYRLNIRICSPSYSWPLRQVEYRNKFRQWNERDLKNPREFIFPRNFFCAPFLGKWSRSSKNDLRNGISAPQKHLTSVCKKHHPPLGGDAGFGQVFRILDYWAITNEGIVSEELQKRSTVSAMNSPITRFPYCAVNSETCEVVAPLTHSSKTHLFSTCDALHFLQFEIFSAC